MCVCIYTLSLSLNLSSTNLFAQDFYSGLAGVGTGKVGFQFYTFLAIPKRRAHVHYLFLFCKKNKWRHGWRI